MDKRTKLQVTLLVIIATALPTLTAIATIDKDIEADFVEFRLRNAQDRLSSMISQMENEENEKAQRHVWDSLEAVHRAQRAEQEALEAQRRDEEILLRRKQQEEYWENLRRKGAVATYDQGYHDGYDCGYDDGDTNAGYGFSWLSDKVMSCYSYAYRNGFGSGYRVGYSDGIEDYEYVYGL